MSAPSHCRVRQKTMTEWCGDPSRFCVCAAVRACGCTAPTPRYGHARCRNSGKSTPFWCFQIGVQIVTCNRLKTPCHIHHYRDLRPGGLAGALSVHRWRPDTADGSPNPGASGGQLLALLFLDTPVGRPADTGHCSARCRVGTSAAQVCVRAHLFCRRRDDRGAGSAPLLPPPGRSRRRERVSSAASGTIVAQGARASSAASGDDRGAGSAPLLPPPGRSRRRERARRW